MARGTWSFESPACKQTQDHHVLEFCVSLEVDAAGNGPCSALSGLCQGQGICFESLQ